MTSTQSTTDTVVACQVPKETCHGLTWTKSRTGDLLDKVLEKVHLERKGPNIDFPDLVGDEKIKKRPNFSESVNVWSVGQVRGLCEILVWPRLEVFTATKIMFNLMTLDLNSQGDRGMFRILYVETYTSDKECRLQRVRRTICLDKRTD